MSAASGLGAGRKQEGGVRKQWKFCQDLYFMRNRIQTRTNKCSTSLNINERAIEMDRYLLIEIDVQVICRIDCILLQSIGVCFGEAIAIHSLSLYIYIWTDALLLRWTDRCASHLQN